MALHRLLYVSFATGGFDLERNVAILREARERNRANGVTGVLLCRDATFLQVLEGAPVDVSETLARIRRDRRHTQVTVLAGYAARERIFPGWQMGFYHLAAIEPKVGEALLPNEDSSLQIALEPHLAFDLIAGIVTSFIDCNARELRFRRELPAAA
jgi:hypothetical protein